MKKHLIFAACMAVCACQPKAMQKNTQPADQNFHERREEKPKGGCCEVEKQKAVQENQTVSTPEVKVEAAK
jgi:hypothetical protein